MAPGEVLDWKTHPTPPRDERASGRRPPQTGTRSAVPAFSFRRTEEGPEDADDESDDFPYHEYGSLDHKGARPRTLPFERNFFYEMAAPVAVDAIETEAGAQIGRQGCSFPREEVDEWLRTVPRATEVGV